MDFDIKCKLKRLLLVCDRNCVVMACGKPSICRNLEIKCKTCGVK